MKKEQNLATDGTVAIPNSTVTQHVVSTMLDMLRSGQYRTGDRLPSERELTERFEVGRSAVREATRDLVALGLLEIRRGRGTYVRSLRSDLLLGRQSFGDHDDVKKELIEVRLIVEPAAAALAAERRRTEDLTRLEQDVVRLAEAVKVGFRPPEDLGFHLDIVHATHNRSLVRVTGAIVSFYDVAEQLPTDKDVAQHRAVFQAIRDQDPDRARTLMHAHVAREFDRNSDDSTARPQ